MNRINRVNLFGAVIVIAIVVFIFLVGYLVYNVEEIKKDPLLAGAKLHKIDSCYCTLMDTSVQFNFNQTDVWRGDLWGVPK